jgi:TatD DNase family protein
MALVDTHAHLYSEEFKEDLARVILSAKENGISKIIMPNIDLSTIESMIKVELDYPTICKSMIGLHPCYVDLNYKTQLNNMYSWLEKHKFIAIGEVGLDLHNSNEFYTEQLAAFETQIEWAKESNLPLIIHSRRSVLEAIKILKKHQNGELKGIFHCFTEDKITADRIVDLGFKLGIGGVMTFKNSSLKDVLKHISSSHIVLETDAPYLAPSPFRGKRNEPSYLLTIAHTLADIKSTTIEAISEETTKNVKDVFDF